MSKEANPFAIGAFLVGALTLLTVGVMIFGGSDFFKEKNRFVIYFDSALNGLNLGAPVKLQGVQIGNVKEILLEIDAESGAIFKPVVIEIDPELLRDASGEHLPTAISQKQRLKNAQKLIEAGIKARLETQSWLTGLLYVDLNFYPNKPLNLHNRSYKNLPELPSVPTTVDEIKNTADELLNRAKQLPLEQLLQDVSETLKAVRNLAGGEDTRHSVAALAKSLQETQRLMESLNKQINPLMTNVTSMVGDTHQTVQSLNQNLLPVLKSAQTSLDTATSVLQASEHTLDALENMASPDAPLAQALQEMRNASRSIKDLAETLERKPNALIYGK